MQWSTVNYDQNLFENPAILVLNSCICFAPSYLCTSLDILVSYLLLHSNYVYLLAIKVTTTRSVRYTAYLHVYIYPLYSRIAVFYARQYSTLTMAAASV